MLSRSEKFKLGELIPILFLIVATGVAGTTQAGSVAPSQGKARLIGYWETFDSHQREAHSVIRIQLRMNKETDEEELVGTIVKVYAHADQVVAKYCTHCRGALRNAKLIGLPILTGLQYRNDRWVNGTVLDPHTGRTYRCDIVESQDGDTLRLKAHKGVFSRTVIWKRVDKPVIENTALSDSE